MTRTHTVLLLSACLAACSQGGLVDRPQSEVRIAANHHVFWFRTLPGFGTFPVEASAVFPGHGVFALDDQSAYTLTLPNNATSSDRYALARSGDFSVFVTGSGRDPSVVFKGGYGLIGDEPTLFFTDRVSAGSSLSIGLYFGTRVVPGQVELAGGWHLLSMHTIFASSGLLDPDNVGRTAHGGITVDTGDPGTVRPISGTGSESTGASLTFGGEIQNLLQGTTGDGSCNLTLTYVSGGNSDSRVFRAAAGSDIVMAVDEDETDGEAGLAFLVRKFNAPATPLDPGRVAGRFFLGGHTLFVNPTNSGADTFVGVLELTSQGGFRIDAQSHTGIDFSYTGSYTAAADGGLTLNVSGTNETWFAAINLAYDTVLVVDDVVENRQNNQPELNLAMGVRIKQP